MKTMKITVKSRHPSLLAQFIPEFKEQIRKDCEEDNVEFETEIFEKEFVITVKGEDEKIKELYEKNKKQMKKTKLTHKFMMKTLGLKVKVDIL